MDGLTSAQQQNARSQVVTVKTVAFVEGAFPQMHTMKCASTQPRGGEGSPHSKRMRWRCWHGCQVWMAEILLSKCHPGPDFSWKGIQVLLGWARAPFCATRATLTRTLLKRSTLPFVTVASPRFSSRQCRHTCV